MRRVEEQDSGHVYNVDIDGGADAAEVVERWTNDRTLGWWLDNGCQKVVLCEGVEFTVTVNLHIFTDSAP